MKRVIVIFISILLISGCKEENLPKNEYHIIDSEEAYKMMTLYDFKEDLIILDVRNTDEFAENRIDGAINVPLMSIEEKIEKVISNKDTIILVYCKSGVRAELASQKLVKLGYTNVYDFGGIDTWPYGLVNPIE